MNISVYQKHLHIFGHVAPFSFRKTDSKMLNFQFFLLRKQHLVATLDTLNETRPPISRYVAEQGMDIPD